jgi:arylsulfatase A-like enzyme
MGIYGYHKNTTPNIDKWAKDALIFTNVRTQVPVTFPSFSMIMTGKSTFDLGIYGNTLDVNTRKITEGVPELPENVLTLAEFLQQKGFETSAFISNPVLFPGYSNIERGFENYEYVNYFLGRENYEDFIVNSLDSVGLNQDQPFFAWIHLMDPHEPYTPQDKYLCKFNDKYCDKVSPDNIKEINEEGEKFQGCQADNLSKEDFELYEMLYDGAVASSDDLVGKILDEVKARGFDKNTIVVFYGDHGEGLDHNYFFKHGGVLFDSSVRIPIIIKVPEMGGRNINNSIENKKLFDIMLTLLNLESGPIDKHFTTEDNHYFISGNVRKFAVKNGDLKYVYSLPDACLFNGQKEELYNLSKDPGELNNLVSERQDLAKKFRSDLFKFINLHGHPREFDDSGEKLNKEQQEILNQLKSLGY